MTNPPHFKGFRPIDLPKENNSVVLNYEEYESIRLSDFELYGQVEAAQIMDISRSTYARIYESARRKIAQAFVLGKPIIFEGGKVYFDSEWYTCNSCSCWFNHTAKEQEIKNCALCNSTDIEQYNNNKQQENIEDICICPKCGNQKEQITTVPCKMEICPKCNCEMIRKGAPHQNRSRNNNYNESFMSPKTCTNAKLS